MSKHHIFKQHKSITMKKLITAEQARKLVSGSEERKQELIDQVNVSIGKQAEIGLRWSHLPSFINEMETEWLREELILNGFKVPNINPVINW